MITTTATTTTGNLVSVAQRAGAFNTLLAAVTAVGLADTLQGPGPFTVFAPTDEAFARLPAGTVDALLQDLPKLKSVLLYHVVPGALMARDVVKLETAKTANGRSVTVDTANGAHVDDARILETDILASNGVIHVIDRVMLPR
jgi:uncharacterized surface protein with fasciclin (FAS1) repeats